MLKNFIKETIKKLKRGTLVKELVKDMFYNKYSEKQLDIIEIYNLDKTLKTHKLPKQLKDLIY